MQQVYSRHLPGLIADFPIAIILVDDLKEYPYYGCYGMLCYLPYKEAKVYYTNPKLTYANFIVINLGYIREGLDDEGFRKHVVMTLAHELAHHALTLSGVDIDAQHKLMYCTGPDQEMADAVGLEWNAAMACIFAYGRE